MEKHHAASIGLATPAEVAAATEEILRLHQETYNDSLWKLKHHMASHVPTMYERAGRLLSCWVHERKHRLIKHFVKDHHFTGGYERSLMLSITAQHISDFGSWGRTAGMQDMRPTPADELGTIQENCRSVRCAQINMRLTSGAQFLRGDMVLIDEAWGGSAAEVWFHVQTDDRLINMLYS